MTRDDEFEAVLRPWMQRHAPDAPNDLVLRINKEIEMSEQAPSGSWLSRFASWPTVAWAVAATAVACVVLAGGMLIANLPGPSGTGSESSQSPTPAVTATPSDPQAVVDRLVAAWNAGGGQAASLYVSSPAVRFMIDSGDFTDRYSDIGVAEAEWSGGGSTLTRTAAVLVQGPYAAFPLTWASADGSGDGVGVIRITSDGLVAEQLVLGSTGSNQGGAGPAQGNVVSMVDALLAAEDVGDGATAAQYFGPDAELRWIKYAELDQPASIGQAAIAAFISTETDGWIWTRTGDPIAQGAFVFYPLDYRAPNGTGAEGFGVVELNAAGTIQLSWGIGYPY
jgi:hypothetical protein